MLNPVFWLDFALAADPAPRTGIVQGQVNDADGLPFPNALVSVPGVGSTRTDAAGRFMLRLPSGEVILVCEAPHFVTAHAEVLVGVAPVDVQLVLIPEQAADFEIVVYAKEVVGGISESIDERREASVVADVLGAEQMAKSGDGNAAAALGRVTGLTLVDDRFVYVRGLGDRYSSTLMNGSTLPSPEPERRVVPLDLFPTGLLDRIVVQKTWSPDMPGEFGGGVVSMVTRGIPNAPLQRVLLTAGYASGATGTLATSGIRGPTDWLGFGNGARKLSQELQDASDASALTERDLFSDRGYTAEELEALGESVDPMRWALQTVRVMPDLGAQLSFARRLDLGRNALGVLCGLSLNNTWNVDSYDQTFFVLGSGGALEAGNEYAFETFTNKVHLGAVLDVGADLGENHEIRNTLIVNRSSEMETRTYGGFNRDLDGDIALSRNRWVERQLVFQQVRGRHRAPTLGDFGVDWRYAVSLADRLEPDTREWRYDYENTLDTYLLSDRPEGNSILSSDLGDVNHDAGADVSLPFGADGIGKVQAGAAFVERRRGVDTRRYSFLQAGSGASDVAVRELSPDQLFTADQIAPDLYQLGEITRQTDNYTAEQHIRAGYALVDLPFAVWTQDAWGLSDLSILGGMRVESSDQVVRTFELFNPDAVPVEASLDTVDALPSVTLTQGLVDGSKEGAGAMQLRAAWARTVSRPDFRELSPATYTDVTGGREVFGNPALDRARIDHVDLRWELYPAPGELVSVGAFGKVFRDPIEEIIVLGAQHAVTWENARGATNVGIEVEARKSLAFVAPLLRHVAVAGNGALVASRVDLSETNGAQTGDARPLQGQSPWVGNVQLIWDDSDHRRSVTLTLQAVGPRVASVGALGAPDTIEHPAPRLDFALNHGLSDHSGIVVRGRNLLDLPDRWTQGDQTLTEVRAGWTLSSSLEWKP